MDKLMTLGIALTALDHFSKPMAKVQESLGSFAKKAGRINVDGLKHSLEEVKQKTDKLNRLKVKLEYKLKRTKTNSDGLKRSIARVDAQLGKLNKRKLSLSESLKRARYDSDMLNKKMQRLGLTLSKYGALSAAAGRMATGKLMETVFAFKEVQKAQGDIASLGIDTAGIEKITESAKKMSKQYAGVTTPEFIKASYDIKSGIASLSSEGVARFTELAAMTGRATKSTTEEMTKLFALGYGIFKNANETDMQFGERFSASIATAVQAFRTDGNDLTLGLSNIGAVAKKMGVSLSEELAVIGNAKDAFNSASEAGTAYRSFLSNAVQAQEKLGISLTDTSGKLLPMRMILEQVRKKFGDLDAMEMKQLKEAFGSDEAVKIITALMDKTDNLAASERKLASAKLDTVEAMAKSRNKGHEFTLMMQKLSVLSSTIGAKLSPLFDAVSGKIAAAADRVEKFISGPFGKWAVYAVVGLSALVLTLGVVGLAAGAFAAYIGYAGKALALFKMFSGMATTGMVLLQAAMSPVVLTVAAIAAAVYLIIDNWSGISEWFAGLWRGVVSTFRQASEWIGKLVTDPIGTISMAWSDLVGWFGGFWSSVTGVFASGANYIAKIFTDPIAWIRTLWAKLLNWLGEKINAIKGIVNSIANFVGYGDVFKISVDGKGGDKKQGTFHADTYKGVAEALKPIGDIAKNTEPLRKPTIAPYNAKQNAKKTASRGIGGSKSSGGGGGGISSHGYGSSGGGKNYNINIRIFGNEPADIANKLSSMLPGLIKDIESNTLGRAMYDL